MLALARGLAQEAGYDASAIRSYYPAPPDKDRKLDANTIDTWHEPLTPAALAGLGIGSGTDADWPDYVVSCRPEVAAVALGIKNASGGKTKILHIQNPNGATGLYNFDLAAFDVIVRQPHESVPGPNVISSRLALHTYTRPLLAEFNVAAEGKIGRPFRPILAILLGGSDEHLELDENDFRKLADDIQAMDDPMIYVVSSRRTGENNMRILRERLAGNPHVHIDDPRLGYDDILGLADRFIATGESFSLVSEALAPEKPVALYTFGDKLQKHPLFPIWSLLEQEGRFGFYPSWPSLMGPRPLPLTNEGPILARRILAYFSLPATTSLLMTPADFYVSA